MFCPVNIRVPLPTQVSEPVPEIACAMVVSKKLVSIVPPSALSVIGRVADRSKLLVNCSVPPLKVSALAPRLSAALTLMTPSLRVVSPV